MTVNLSALEQKLAGATPRPWELAPDVGIVHRSCDNESHAVRVPGMWSTDEDEALVVEAVNALPALIAAVKALRNAVVLESAADFTDDENADLRQRAEACYAALAAFSSEEQA